MTEPTSRLYRISRWFVVHLLAFAMRHGLDDHEALDALKRAYPHRAGNVEWRLAVVDDADRRNVQIARRKAGW